MNVDLEVVTIPVSDVDNALYFYRDQLGLRVDTDINRDEFRVVQMTPTGEGHTSIVFGRGIPLAAEPGWCRGHRDLPRARSTVFPCRAHRWPRSEPHQLRVLRIVHRPGRQRLDAPGGHRPPARSRTPQLSRPTWSSSH